MLENNTLTDLFNRNRIVDVFRESPKTTAFAGCHHALEESMVPSHMGLAHRQLTIECHIKLVITLPAAV